MLSTTTCIVACPEDCDGAGIYHSSAPGVCTTQECGVHRLAFGNGVHAGKLRAQDACYKRSARTAAACNELLASVITFVFV